MNNLKYHVHLMEYSRIVTLGSSFSLLIIFFLPEERHIDFFLTQLVLLIRIINLDKSCYRIRDTYDIGTMCLS